MRRDDDTATETASRWVVGLLSLAEADRGTGWQDPAGRRHDSHGKVRCRMIPSGNRFQGFGVYSKPSPQKNGLAWGASGNLCC
jgi:hypothetical protein